MEPSAVPSFAAGTTSTIHLSIKRPNKNAAIQNQTDCKEPQTGMPKPFPAGEVILVPHRPAFRLREASPPLGRDPAAFGPGLGLRGGAIPASTALMSLGTGCFDGISGVPFVLMLTTAQPGLGAEVAPSVWAPRRRWQRFVAVRRNPALVIALCLLKGTAVVQHSLRCYTLQDRTLSIGGGQGSWRAEPLLLSPRALRLGHTVVLAHPSESGFILDDAPFQRWVITLRERSRGQSLRTVWQRIPHFSFLQTLCQVVKKVTRFSMMLLLEEPDIIFQWNFKKQSQRN